VRCLERFSATLSHRSPEAILVVFLQRAQLYVYWMQTWWDANALVVPLSQLSALASPLTQTRTQS
jgi:hypothetical protein